MKNKVLGVPFLIEARLSIKTRVSMTEYVYKVCIIGDIKVGKTSFRNKLCHNTFSEHYKSTIGVDFGLKVKKNDMDMFRVQLWDIAGVERFGTMMKIYLKETLGTFVMVDPTNLATIDGAKKWKKTLDLEMDKSNWTDPTINTSILLVNKMDLIGDNITETIAFCDKFCEENQFHSWFAISSKTGDGIEQALDAMVKLCKRVSVIQEEEPLQMPGRKVDDDSFLMKYVDDDSFLMKYVEPAHNAVIGLYQKISNSANRNPVEYTIDKFVTDMMQIIANNKAEVSVLKLKLSLSDVYFGSEANSFRAEAKINKKLRELIDKIYDILMDESIDDGTKINRIIDLTLKFGRSRNL